ncbi:MAG TPA: hypothetical protein VF155_05280 [Candidatus Dormibacteraeota bacterium]
MAHFNGDKLWLILGLIFEQLPPEVVTTLLTSVLPPPVVDMWEGSGKAAFADFMGRVRTA